MAGGDGFKQLIGRAAEVDALDAQAVLVEKPRSSATDTGDWQTAVWLHAILKVRGAVLAASTREPSMPSGAARPATPAAQQRAAGYAARQTPGAVRARVDFRIHQPSL